MFSRSALMHVLSMLTMMQVLFFSAPALADYNTGIGAYSRKDFPVARTAFQQVAQLGDAGGQRALATMHARGEGGTVDLIEGFAWASLATEQGDTTASKIRDTIVAGMPAGLKPQADARWQTYRGLYGVDALKRNLHASVSANDAWVFGVQVPAARLRQQQPVEYPERAKEKNEQGYTCVSFYVDSSGKPLDIRRYDSKGSGVLAGATERLLTEWRFEPEADERRVAHCIEFLIEDDKTWRSRELLQQQVAKGRKGDARSLTDLAREFSTSQHNVVNRVEAQAVTEAWQQAALAGAAEAQFELASRLLRGDGCIADRNKAMRWLQLAIAQDYPPAKQTAALLFSADKSLAMTPAQQGEWLQLAADNGNVEASLRIAKNLLRPGPGQNASVALNLLEKLDPDQHIHVLDWRAHARALLGDFDDALEDAEDALERATEMGLATEARQAAVDTLTSGSLSAVPKNE